VTTLPSQLLSSIALIRTIKTVRYRSFIPSECHPAMTLGYTRASTRMDFTILNLEIYKRRVVLTS